MAISLNNHESRIVALEKKSHKSSFEIKMCHNGFISNTTVTIPSVTNYPNAFISVIVDNGGQSIASGTGFSEKTMNVSVLKKMSNYVFRIGDPMNSHDFRFGYKTDTSIKCFVEEGNESLFRVYWTNLTIYYIVRYNIYKHLLKLMRR